MCKAKGQRWLSTTEVGAIFGGETTPYTRSWVWMQIRGGNLPAEKDPARGNKKRPYFIVDILALEEFVKKMFKKLEK